MTSRYSGPSGLRANETKSNTGRISFRRSGGKKTSIVNSRFLKSRLSRSAASGAKASTEPRSHSGPRRAPDLRFALSR